MKAIYFSALLVLAASCSKNDSTPEDKTKVITTGTWKYDRSGMDFNLDGVAESDLPPGYLQSCDTDNLLTFNADSTGVVDEGLTKCDAADPQTVNFTWSFNADKTVINFPTAVISNVSGDVTVKKLTSTELDLQKQMTYMGTNVNIIIEFKK